MILKRALTRGLQPARHPCNARGVSEIRTHPAVQAIRNLLDEQEISNLELARRLGWGRMQVQRRLSGEVDLTVTDLEEIADALGVPITQFIGTKPTAASAA